MSRTPISRESFRRACSRFATGVAVATLLDNSGHPRGLTVNSFTSVSADPALVLICINQDSSLLPLFRQSPYYGLSFLAETQQHLSIRFAALPEGRFQGLEWKPGLETGVPILDGAVGWMECALREVVEAGDHAILIAEVRACGAHQGEPLLYFGSGYQRLWQG